MFKWLLSKFDTFTQEVVQPPVKTETPESKEEIITITYPDGAVAKLRYDDKTDSYYNSLGAFMLFGIDLPDMSKWTPPMTELMMLYIKDKDNFIEKQSSVGSRVFTHPHFQYIVVVDYLWGMKVGIDSRTDVSGLTHDEVLEIVRMLKIYVNTDKYEEIEQRKLNIEKYKKLKQGKKEAAKINAYLEGLNKWKSVKH